MATATLIFDNPVNWAPGTKIYATSDGKHYAVEATNPADIDGNVIPMGDSPVFGEIVVEANERITALKVIVRQTTVFVSNENGETVSSEENNHDPLLPVRLFPAGLSHEDALAAMGYEV